ncbi:hypothetical protein MASR1M12_31740 [Erysipelotrichia bacterium]
MPFTYEYPRPSVTLDAAIIRVPDLANPEILLIKRGREPFAGRWALPGGFLEMDETPCTGAARELKEETRLENLPLKPLFTCGEPGRDPRGRTITMVYGCMVRDTDFSPRGDDDAADACWFDIRKLPEMAFDHDRVIAQIHASLVWQARHLIVGQNVFNGRATAEELKNCMKQSVKQRSPACTGRKVGLLVRKNGFYEFAPFDPSGPDWHPLVW